LRIGDRLGGHMVSGHVDGVGAVLAIQDSGDGGRVLSIDVPGELARYLIAKGSVTIDGVSLTVVEPRGARFQVALIPETLARTTLSDAAPGTRVHVEADSIGKWIERLLAARE
jgi:riboflavin synthase